MAKICVLLPSSLELQNGCNKSLLTTSVSSSSTIVGVEKPISIDSNPIVPKPKKAKKAEWELNKVFQDIWGCKIALGRGNDGS